MKLSFEQTYGQYSRLEFGLGFFAWRSYLFNAGRMRYMWTFRIQLGLWCIELAHTFKPERYQ